MDIDLLLAVVVNELKREIKGYGKNPDPDTLYRICRLGKLSIEIEEKL